MTLEEKIQVAELLETKFSVLVQAHPETLARHYSEAGFADQAVTYWLEAGRLAQQRSANQEAIGHLNQGLEQLDLLPDGRQRATMPTPSFRSSPAPTRVGGFPATRLS